MREFMYVSFARYYRRRAGKILFYNMQLDVDTSHGSGVKDRLNWWRGIQSCWVVSNR